VAHSVGTAPSSPPSFETAGAQTEVISACEDSVKKMLKDPGSATFDGWTASEGGAGPPASMHFNPEGPDRYYSASEMVNAKNGFGGYDGDEQYSCDAIVSSSTIRAQARTGSDPTAGYGG
jgi:hypothetical protein